MVSLDTLPTTNPSSRQVKLSNKSIFLSSCPIVQITSSSNMSKEDIDRAVKEAEQFAAEDKKRREFIETKKEVLSALEHGALAVSTGKKELWYM